MSYIEAAYSILKQAGKPLHYRELTRIAIERGLVQPEGLTPEASMAARLSVEIKRGKAEGRFIRLGPGTFGLRELGGEQNSGGLQSDHHSDRRVRVPLFPLYSEVRLVLPLWEGLRRPQITGLRSTLQTLWGNPKNPVDWTNPDEWIPERLSGQERSLAERIWEGTGKQVNPRHIYGHWTLAITYKLIHVDKSDCISITDLGRDFVRDERGRTVALLDEHEGLLKLLTIVAEKGPGRRGNFVPEWGEYLKRRSNFGTDSTVKDTLTRRLQNLVERELLTRQSTIYSVTDSGLSYLKKLGGDEEAEASEEQQEIWNLVKKHLLGTRARMQELLDAMDPFAFEHLVKQLLEAMDYQNVIVTAPSGDKGVDVIADIELGITSVREVVQVKRHRGCIQRKDLDALRGSLHRFNAVRGTIITTNDFAKGTTEAAFERGAAPITLINGDKLIDLLIQHNIGVRKKSIELLELDTDAFIGDESEERPSGSTG
jgi:restriction system protein